MAIGLPEVQQSVLAQQIGVVRQDDAGAGLARLGQSLGAIAREGQEFVAEAVGRYKAELDTTLRTRAIEIASRNKYNPSGFAAEWSGVEAAIAKAAPLPVQNDAALYARLYGERAYTDMLAETRQRDRDLANKSIQKAIEHAYETVATLERQGKARDAKGIPTGEFAGHMERLEGHLKRALDARLLDNEGAQQIRDALADEVTTEGIARTGTLLSRAGDTAGALKYIEQARDRMPATLGRNRIESIVGAAKARISENEQARRIAEDMGRKDLAERLDSLMKSVKGGYDLDQLKIGEIAQLAGRLGMKKQAETLNDIASMAPEINALRRGSVTDFAAFVRRQQDHAASNPDDDRAASRAQFAAQMYQLHLDQIKTDGFAYGARLYRREIGEVPQLDFSKPDTIKEQLAARVRVADRISAAFNVAVSPMFADETMKLTAQLSALPASDRARAYALVFAGLGENYGKLFFQQMAAGPEGKGDLGKAHLVAAGLAPADNAAAAMILRGVEAMKTKPEYAPKDDASFRAPIDRYLGDALKHLPNVRGYLDEAVRAYIAAENAAAGDTQQRPIGSSKIEEVVEKIVGKVVTINGQKTILPRNMPENEFRARLWGARREDFGGKLPIAADGTEIDPAKLVQYATFEVTGMGMGGNTRHLVLVNGQAVLNPVTKRPLEIDATKLPLRYYPASMRPLSFGDPIMRAVETILGPRYAPQRIPGEEFWDWMPGETNVTPPAEPAKPTEPPVKVPKKR